MVSGNDILQRAEVRRQTLLRELERLEEFIGTYRALQVGAPLGSVPGPSTASRPARPGEIENHVSKLLALRQPRPTNEVLAKLAEDGVRVGGKDPGRNLSSILSHSDDFENIRGQGWILAEKSEGDELEDNPFASLPSGTVETTGDLDDEIPF